MTEPKLLGDKVEDALKKVHADKVAKIIERVTKKPCKCKERKEKLNALHKRMQEMKRQVALEQMKNAPKQRF